MTSITDKILSVTLSEYCNNIEYVNYIDTDFNDIIGVQTGWLEVDKSVKPYDMLAKELSDLLKNKNKNEDALKAVVNVKIDTNHTEMSMYYMISGTAIIKK